MAMIALFLCQLTGRLHLQQNWNHVLDDKACTIGEMWWITSL
jgi:hypothetical protein